MSSSLILLSWIATLLTMINVFCLAKKLKIGWVLGIVGSWLWIMYAVGTYQPALVVVNVLLFGVNVYGLIEWRK